MSDIDEATGLPKLPEGMRWKIRRRPDGPWANSLEIRLQQRSRGVWWSVGKDVCAPYGPSIQREARRVLAKWRVRQIPPADLTPFIGVYPPKKLEDQ